MSGIDLRVHVSFLVLVALFAAAEPGRSLLPLDFVADAWLGRLAWLNLMLGVFNLLPAFPLDGRRVFRSLLERNPDLEAATRIATRVGHAFAGGLIVVRDVMRAAIGGENTPPETVVDADVLLDDDVLAVVQPAPGHRADVQADDQIVVVLWLEDIGRLITESSSAPAT